VQGAACIEPEEPSAPPTVYTVRLNTSHSRGSALDDAMAGVAICLVGRRGAALLHRLSPCEDSRDSQDIMRGICEARQGWEGLRSVLG